LQKTRGKLYLNIVMVVVKEIYVKFEIYYNLSKFILIAPIEFYAGLAKSSINNTLNSQVIDSYYYS